MTRWLVVGIEMKPTGQPALELVPSADSTFYNADHDVRIRADVPASGPVTSFALEQRQIKLTYRR
jgi:hypothetical protein